jgi:anti-sigma-K factor RskA
MKESKVKFVIKPGGEIKLEVLEGSGESCIAATKDLEISLLAAGGSKTGEGKKPEFYDGGGADVFNSLTD